MPEIKLSGAVRAGFAVLIVVLAAGSANARAATPLPIARPSSGPLESGALQYKKAPLPKKALHASYVIEVNRKGQVARVRSGTSSHDRLFDAMTYGNVIQAFIRTPDGKAISGVYKMSYDYSPVTKRIRRTVSLLHAGGVDPSALGAVDAMAAQNQRTIQALKRQYEATHRPTPAPAHSPP